MKIKDIVYNPKNPRFIKDENFQKLVTSIKEFPRMMELRPIIIDENNVILGGNMRYKALIELGYEEIPKEWVKQAKNLTPEEINRFVVADNVDFGEWDYKLLAESWNGEELKTWGLDVPDFEFKPNTNPEKSQGKLTDEDIKKKQQELDSNGSKNPLLRDVICPKCFHEFQIESDAKKND